MSVNHSEIEAGVPSFARKEVYNFDATKDNSEIYLELNKIAEEIEGCRLRNC